MDGAGNTDWGVVTTATWFESLPLLRIHYPASSTGVFLIQPRTP